MRILGFDGERALRQPIESCRRSRITSSYENGIVPQVQSCILTSDGGLYCCIPGPNGPICWTTPPSGPIVAYQPGHLRKSRFS